MKYSFLKPFSLIVFSLLLAGCGFFFPFKIHANVIKTGGVMANTTVLIHGSDNAKNKPLRALVLSKNSNHATHLLLPQNKALKELEPGDIVFVNGSYHRIINTEKTDNGYKLTIKSAQKQPLKTLRLQSL